MMNLISIQILYNTKLSNPINQINQIKLLRININKNNWKVNKKIIKILIIYKKIRDMFIHLKELKYLLNRMMMMIKKIISNNKLLQINIIIINQKSNNVNMLNWLN